MADENSQKIKKLVKFLRAGKRTILISALITIAIALIIVILYYAANSDAHSFWGSVIGGAIGGTATFCAYYFTQKYYRDKDSLMERKIYEPNIYCDIFYLQNDLYDNNSEYDLVFIKLGDSIAYPIVEYSEGIAAYSHSELILRNNGNDTAVNLSIRVDKVGGIKGPQKPLLSLAKNQTKKFLVKGVDEGDYHIVLNYEDINTDVGYIYTDISEVKVHLNPTTNECGVTPLAKKVSRRYKRKK